MKKVFLIHGYMGEPNGGWRPWLMGKLAKEEVWAYSLNMPAQDDSPTKEEWVAEIKRAVGEATKDVFLVGHSLGVPAILRYIETFPAGTKIGGAVLVSGPNQKLNSEKVGVLDNFFEGGFDYERIKNNSGHFSVIHGDDDTRVPFSHAEDLSKKLSCELVSVKNGGHLNGSSGWYESPEVFNSLIKMIKSYEN